MLCKHYMEVDTVFLMRLFHKNSIFMQDVLSYSLTSTIAKEHDYSIKHSVHIGSGLFEL